MTHKKLSFFISFFVHMLFLSLLSMIVLQKTTPLEIQEPKKLLISLKSLEHIVTKEEQKPSVEAPKQEVVNKVEQKRPKEMPKEMPNLQQNSKPLESIESIKPVVNVENVTKEPQRVMQDPPKEVLESPKVLFNHKEYAKANFNALRDGIVKNILYPQAARRMKQSGVVELLVVVGVDGKIVDITISKSSGFALLDGSALEAAKILEDSIFEKPLEETKIKLPIEFILN